TQVELKNTPPEPQELWMFRSYVSDSPVERKPIRQWRQHQVKESDRHKVIDTIGQEPSALGGANLKKPGDNRRESTCKSDKKPAARNKQATPCNGEDRLLT